MRNVVLREMNRFIPEFRPSVIFDVGANIGMSAIEFVELLPDSRVFSFEPVRATFEELKKACSDLPSVECFNTALGAKVDTVVMKSADTSTTNRVLPGGLEGPGRESVQMTTGDIFCAEHGITNIDFLKIDAEGHDMEVLKGFIGMLAKDQIGMVQVECSLNPANQRHVALEHFKDLLGAMGYGLFGLFSIKRFRGNRALVMFCDAVFMSKSAASRF